MGEVRERHSRWFITTIRLTDKQEKWLKAQATHRASEAGARPDVAALLRLWIDGLMRNPRELDRLCELRK